MITKNCHSCDGYSFTNHPSRRMNTWRIGEDSWLLFINDLYCQKFTRSSVRRRIETRVSYAMTRVESLRYIFLRVIAVRRAYYDSIRFIENDRLMTRWRSVKSCTSIASSSHRGHAKTWKIHVELSSRTIQNSYPTARRRSWEYQELYSYRNIYRTYCEIILKITQRMKLKRIEWWNVLTDSTKFHFWK